VSYVPVPVKVTACGLVGSPLRFTAMLALSADPPPVGLNVTAIVHDEPAVCVAPQVPPVTLKSPFAPVIVAPKASGDRGRSPIVTVLVFESLFFVSVPYPSVTGVTLAGIVGPVLSVTV
jgi:hypothetical protein